MTLQSCEPIAICGIGCRFPGAASPDALWRMLVAAQDAISEVPAGRWDGTALQGAAGGMRGGFLEEVQGFDWRTLRISPREAAFMDPQHRLALEVAWEAFEDAGLPLEALARTPTAVVVGVTWGDYQRMQARHCAQLDGHAAAGTPFAFAANRISHVFDLRGPSFALDATCSSSLVAIHQACHALWSGQATLALAGGVNLMLSPEPTVMMSRAGVLSPSGRCRALDAAADGFVRGEGVGLIVLKPASQVVASDRVYAWIRGTSVGHNGRNEWVMAPSESGQTRAIVSACELAGLDPAQLDYVELHGTGFLHGDMVEARALGSALGAGRARPCLVGSIKTNLGNLESAAGVASIIKVALGLHHAAVPPTLNFETPNPRIAFDELGLMPATTLVPWPESELPLAGVSTTSLSGVNAHAVLSGAENPKQAAAEPDVARALLVLSARTPQSLLAFAQKMAEWLCAPDRPALRDIVYTAASRRSHHAHRLAAVGDLASLVESLRAFVRGQPAAGLFCEASSSAAVSDALEAAAQRFVADQSVDWTRVIAAGRCVSLPTYAWQHDKLWLPWLDAGAQPAPELATNALEQPSDESAALRRALERAPSAQARQHLTGYLRALLRSTLGLDPDHPLDMTQPLFELGLSSTLAVKLSGQLQAALSAKLPATLLLEQPTLGRLTDYLHERVRASATARGESSQAVAATKPSPARNTGIAVVGVGCRLPGGIDDLDALWRALCERREVRGEVPADRWEVDAFYDPDPSAPGKMVARCAGFREHIDLFDADFFGVSAREAAEIDPQHRLVLEAAWEALEDAGIAPSSLSGTRTGVFVGIMSSDYAKRYACHDDYRAVSAYTVTGNELSFAPGRVAYLLGLRGPCVAVDSACSSSLVALHQASSSLRAGECDLALAGGVSLMLTPELSVFLTKAHVLAPDGRCKAFDAAADGIGRGEGGAMVVLKRLDDALLSNDRILCVIRGSATNHDGRSSGLTVPSGSAQQELLRTALTQAEVEPHEVAYVEAHGTGTPLGDVVEARALAEVFGSQRQLPLFVGSIKTNFGHLDAAAGITGFLKVALSLHHARIAPQAHFETPNPEIPWRAGRLEVATTVLPWPGHDADSSPRRLAGVSSFGLSGVNAHVIVEAAPEVAPQDLTASRSLVVLPVSARSDAALRELAGAYARRLRAAPELEPSVLAAASAASRDHYERRLAVVGRDREQVIESLERLARAEPTARGFQGSHARGCAPRIAFVFCGMGASPVGVGSKLFCEEPVFRAAFEEVDAALGEVQPGLSVRALIEPGTASAQPIAHVQPLTFAVGVALSALWRSFGVHPEAVVGHSMGEVTAAYVSGALNLHDAARVVCARSRELQKVSGLGSMAVIELPERELSAWLPPATGLSIAAVNAPSVCVVSGSPPEVSALVERLSQRAVGCRRLDVEHAFHGPQMDPLLASLRRELLQLQPRAGTSTFISTVTGRAHAGSDLGPDYWADNLRRPVRFADALQGLVRDEPWLLVEIGTHPILRPHLQASAPRARVVGSLRRAQDEIAALEVGLAQAYVAGANVDWRGVLRSEPPKIELPTYPWQRQRHWIAAADSCSSRAGRKRSAHPLLGRELSTALNPSALCFERQIEPERLGELVDHRLAGRVLMPGTAIADLALLAGQATLGGEVALQQLSFREPLYLDHAHTLQSCVERLADGTTASFQLASRAPSGDWLVHATATLQPARAAALPGFTAGAELAELQRQTPSEGAQFYAELAATGLQYGPAYRGVRRLWRGDDAALVELEWAAHAHAHADASQHCVQPALLDAALHALLAAQGVAAESAPWVPVTIGELRVYERPCADHAPMRSYARVSHDPSGALVGDVWLLSESGRCLVAAAGVRLKRMSRSAAHDLASCLYIPRWEHKPLATQPQAPAANSGERWLLVAAPASVSGGALAALARRHGVQVCQADFASTSAVQGSFDRVLVLVGLDEAEQRACDTTEALVAQQAAGVEAVLALIAELVDRADGSPPPRSVCFVTRGTQAVRERERVVPTHAAVWGITRTLGYEQPQVSWTLADLSAVNSAELEALVAEQLAAAPEPELALRDDARYVARLQKLAPRSRTRAWRCQGTYLVTGGLGGLGLRIADWLVSQGASQLVLVGRSAPGAAQQAALAGLRARGCAVKVAQVDVADARALAQLMAEIAATLPPLRGVVHAAGVLADGTLEHGDRAWLWRALAPKLRGAYNLHLLTRAHALDCFVLYGSCSGLLGSPGQGNYAAGNAFLQSLAQHRHSLGLPALCVDWGAIADAGMAARTAEINRFQKRGMSGLDPAESTAWLGQLLHEPEPELCVAAIDFDAWAAAHEHLRHSPRLTGLLRTDGHAQASEPMLRELLASLPAGEHQPAVEARVRADVSRVLHQAVQVDRATPLTQAGVDSLTALELRNRVEAWSAIRLPMSAFLNGAGLAGIARALLERSSSESLLESVRDSTPTENEDGWEVLRL